MEVSAARSRHSCPTCFNADPPLDRCVREGAEGKQCPACLGPLATCLWSSIPCQSMRRMPAAERAHHQCPADNAEPEDPIWEQLSRRVLVLRGYQRRADKRLRQRRSPAATWG